MKWSVATGRIIILLTLMMPVFAFAQLVLPAGYTSPTDLNHYDVMRKPNKASSTWLGGRGNDTAWVETLSPVAYINKNSPPVFIVHGDQDHTVPYEQSVTLFEKLKLAGVKVEMYTVKGGIHGNFSQQENEEINKRILFFVESIF